MSGNLDPLFNSWLPKAERWLEADRDATIGVLVVFYAIVGPDEIRPPGWHDLPEACKKLYGDTPASIYRLNASSIVAIAKHGNQSGWKQLFSIVHRHIAHWIHLKPPPPTESLNGDDKWVMLLSNLLWRGLIDDSFGGKRYNLEPGHCVQIGTGEESQALEDVRFQIDLPTNPKPLKEHLERSADEYGSYWQITDLRAATIDAIHWFKSVHESATAETSTVIAQSDRASPWNWSQYEEWAKERVGTLQQDYKFQNSLCALANSWTRILSLKSKDHDELGKLVAQFLESYSHAASLWNQTGKEKWPPGSGATIGHHTRPSVAEAAMDYYHDMRNILFDGPMRSCEMHQSGTVPPDVCKVFQDSLRNDLTEKGIRYSPADTIALESQVETGIMNEASQLSNLGRKRSSGGRPAEDSNLTEVIRAYLLAHHCYNKQKLNTSAASLPEIAEATKTSKATASRFVAKHFTKYAYYKAICERAESGDETDLVLNLKCLAGEVTPERMKNDAMKLIETARAKRDEEVELD